MRLFAVSLSLFRKRKRLHALAWKTEISFLLAQQIPPRRQFGLAAVSWMGNPSHPPGRGCDNANAVCVPITLLFPSDIAIGDGEDGGSEVTLPHQKGPA